MKWLNILNKAKGEILWQEKSMTPFEFWISLTAANHITGAEGEGVFGSAHQQTAPKKLQDSKHQV